MSQTGETGVVRSWAGRAGGRLREGAWRIALAAVTASAAWVLAQLILQQRAPIFAPIAAVVCLTDAASARGRRVLRLLGGVCVGVVVGELSGVVIGSGWLQVAAAVAVGMLVVSLASINSLTLLQAGIASLLVVGLSAPAAGWTRLASAVIGGLLALLVSQVLASPSPVRLLTDAARTTLRRPASALTDVAGALRAGSVERAEAATEDLRAGHQELAGFLDTRASADALATTTVRGRRERGRVHDLQRRFHGVEYVYAGTVLLARTATEVLDDGADVPEHLVRGVEELAASLDAVAECPAADDPTTDDPVRDACGRAHAIAEEVAGVDPGAHDDLAARLATQLHLLATDVATLTDRPASTTAATT